MNAGEGLMRWIMGGVVLVTLCMLIALLGRIWDWSPFALVICGAVLGLSFGVGITVLVYEVDVPDDDDAGNPDDADAGGLIWGAEPCGAIDRMRSYVCSRPRHHSGDHAAYLSGDPLASWPRS